MDALGEDEQFEPSTASPADRTAAHERMEHGRSVEICGEVCPTPSHAWCADDLQEEYFEAMVEGDGDCDSVNGDQDEVDNITLGMCTWIVFCAFFCFFFAW